MSNSNQTMAVKTLTSVGNLIKLLPTGTVFMFHFLNPVLTNNGQCHTINKYLSGILVAVSAFSCCFASFTDSYEDSEGISHYGIATNKGLWPNSSSQDLSSYRLRFGDFVHAFFSLIVFSVVAMLDPNTVECFYPSFESTQKVLLMALPPVIGAISAFESTQKVLLMTLPPVIGAISCSIFVIFPNTRHGIGYPSSPSPSSSSSSSSSKS